ncbi:MAG: GspE/PulE family protein [Planctomycetota bacterium]
MIMRSASQSAGSRGASSTPLRVGDLMLERGIVSQEQLDAALAYQKKQPGLRKLLGEVLVEMGFVSEEQVMEALAEAYGVPFAKVNPKLVDAKVVEMLPREFLEKNKVLPLFCIENKLTVAMQEPANVFVSEEIEKLTGKSVQIVATTLKDIEATLTAYMPDGNVFVIDEVIDDVAINDLAVVEKEILDIANLADSADASPIIKLVNFLIYSAVKDGASDIHIEPDENKLRVRFRVDGRMFEKICPPHMMQAAVVSRIKIMAGMDISERRVPQDGGITIRIQKSQIDLRVSTCPGRFGEKVVMRIIDNRNAMVRLEKIGFSYEMLESFRAVVHQPNGVFLVTGPTGSGKSTTLYSALNEINDEAINICTVEDPIEQNIPGVNQFQVHEKAGFTFAGALRSLLRQDPDVIMVGEVRDQETARIATQAALTGHLVLSTLHTNDAPSAVTRLFNIGVEPYLVAAAIRGVLAQRLVRKICTHCKEPMDLNAQTKRTLHRIADGVREVGTVYHGVGCSKCRNTGYAGRIGLFELLIPNDELLDAVSRGGTLQEVRKAALTGEGYTPLRLDGLDKVSAGLTTLEELFRATSV